MKDHKHLRAKRTFHKMLSMIVTHGDIIPKKIGALTNKLNAQDRESLQYLRSCDINDRV